MGTRGAYGFRFEGKDKVTYNHWDSYPAVLGEKIIKMCNEHTVEELQELFKKIRLVKNDEAPTPEDEQIFEALLEDGIGYREDYYSLLRGLQGQPEQLFNYPIMTDDNYFLDDSLFCEWAYIINLDNKTLEVYEGFTKKSWGAKGRYAKRKDPYDADGTKYYGVRLTHIFTLPEYSVDRDAISTSKIDGDKLQLLTDMQHYNNGLDITEKRYP